MTDEPRKPPEVSGDSQDEAEPPPPFDPDLDLITYIEEGQSTRSDVSHRTKPRSRDGG